MTWQEILEGITRHRANPVSSRMDGSPFPGEIERKVTEIEWALQAIVEKLRDSNPEEGK